MPTYFFMVGIPASGKSAYARSIGCRVVCPDEIRKQHLDWSGDQVFDLARQEIAATLQSGADVVLDASATIRHWRGRDIAAGKPYADRVVCILMDTPLDVCLRRNVERIRKEGFVKIPASEVERMARQLASNPPDLSEGFDEVIRVGLDEQLVVKVQ